MKMTLDILNKICICYPKDIEFIKENKLIGLEDIDFIEKSDARNMGEEFIYTIIVKVGQPIKLICHDVYEKKSFEMTTSENNKETK